MSCNETGEGKRGTMVLCSIGLDTCMIVDVTTNALCIMTLLERIMAYANHQIKLKVYDAGSHNRSPNGPMAQVR